MPLLRIWKLLRGQPEDARPPGETVVDAPRARLASPSKPMRGILKRDPHGALRRMVKPLPVGSILEISVGDGSTAEAVLDTLAKRQSGSIRYAAIDEFELSGSAITLKEFHQRLRKLNVRPRLFPDTLERGLLRVANTIGSVDLVLIGATAESWQTPSVLKLVERVTHSDSVVLHLQGEYWSRFEFSSPQRFAA